MNRLNLRGFKWEVDGVFIEIIFNLCRNGKWMESPRNRRRVGILFDYLDHEGIALEFSDMENLSEDARQKLLQVLGLESPCLHR
jgi:hypothetical protein